jgi:DNA-binding NtrC family response regulator
MEAICECAVLIVEPDPVIGALISSFVYDLGFSGFHATDAVNAVRLHRQIGDVAAVITEMDLPGPWNAKQLRDALHHLQPEVPVIVAFTRSAYEEVAMAWDMPFLRKPFSAEDLFALLTPAQTRLVA